LATRGNLSSLLSSNFKLSPLIYNPDRDEEAISDLFLSRAIKLVLLSLQTIRSEFYPGAIFLSLSNVGRLST